MFNYRQRIWNGGPELPTKTLFDGVLLDAPCSGVGTWGRNPHARWTTTLTDVNELREKQKALLGHASAAVGVGGRLVYAVCTLTRSETETVAAWFDGEFKQFEPAPITNPLGKGSKPEMSGRLWLWPQETGANGMFVASWTRRAINSNG